jgi:hypothetical protein
MFQVEISFSSRYSQLAELSCIESGIDIIRVSFLFYHVYFFWEEQGMRDHLFLGANNVQHYYCYYYYYYFVRPTHLEDPLKGAQA